MTGRESADRVLESRLLRYALTAGVALACHVPAHGEVVFTPSNVRLHGGWGLLAIDLDNDGNADFTLIMKNVRSFSGYGLVKGFKVYGNQPFNQIAVTGISHNGGQAAALTKQTQIGAGPRFDRSAGMETYFGWGYWSNVTNRFLGVRLLINGETHYGWIGFRRVSGLYQPFVANLAGWAYENNPNTPIIAGDIGGATGPVATIDPTSLEILSAGHSGIEQHRKRNAP